MGVKNITKESRNIEGVELDYFMRQSGSRLKKVKSGTTLGNAIKL